MRGRRHASRVTAALCAAALVASGACTNDESAGGGSGGGGAGDSTGVTDEVIRIGWPALDQAALVDAGLATDLGDPTAIAQGIVDDWNAAGGVNGRQVELVTRTYGTDIANLLRRPTRSHPRDLE